MYMIGFVLEVVGSDTVLSPITFKSSFFEVVFLESLVVNHSHAGRHRFLDFFTFLQVRGRIIYEQYC